MEKSMKVNFELLRERVKDSFEHTDLDRINYELSHIEDAAVISGVGGSSVVSEMGARVLEGKNGIITKNMEPRDFVYSGLHGFKNVVSCSYSGDNYGVDMAFQNDLKHYLLSNNLSSNGDVTSLRYVTTIDKERSFVSLGATLIPVSILVSYYNGGHTDEILDLIRESKFSFDTDVDAYEIFSGCDTSVASKYLESTLVESGIGIPVVHDKYSYCHGRSTLCMRNKNAAIYFNRGTEFDRLMLRELSKYYKSIIVIEPSFEDPILDDYQMLIQSMFLTKFIAEQKRVDLSKVDYSPIVKELYTFKGSL